MYHHIGTMKADVWTVSPQDFEIQMQQLKDNGYNTILPSDLIEYLHRRRSLPQKPVIITFDDGSLSLKDIVYPILKKHGFQAIAYLVTSATSDSSGERGKVDGQPCLTWPEVRHLHQDGTFAFGGHTRHHDRRILATNSAVEVETCCRDIAQKGGFEPDSFCYAHNEGAGDKKVEECVRKAGFTTAMTCTEGRANIRKKTNMFRLRRLWIRGGQHTFSATPASKECARGNLSLVLVHEGFPLPVTPRFRWPSMSEEEGWLPALTIGSGSTLFTSSTTVVPKGQDAVGFELWDTNRFFRLYEWPSKSR
jgi:hypothetical protein